MVLVMWVSVKTKQESSEYCYNVKSAAVSEFGTCAGNCTIQHIYTPMQRYVNDSQDVK